MDFRPLTDRQRADLRRQYPRERHPALNTAPDAETPPPARRVYAGRAVLWCVLAMALLACAAAWLPG